MPENVIHLTLTGYEAGQVVCGAVRVPGGSYVHATYCAVFPVSVCPDCVRVWEFPDAGTDAEFNFMMGEIAARRAVQEVKQNG